MISHRVCMVLSLLGMAVYATAATNVPIDTPTTPSNASNATAAVTSPAASDEIVARVNDDVIRRSNLDLAMHAVRFDLARRGQTPTASETAQLERQVLDDMVNRLLLLQEARKQPPADLEERVRQALAMLEKRMGGAVALQDALAEAGVSSTTYTNQVRDNLLIEALLNRLFEEQIKVTPEQAREFYEQHLEEFREPETVRASHILILVPPDAPPEVKAEKRAQIDVVRVRLEMGEKFADVARQVSQDPGSAAQGGDLGYFPRGRMVPEFEEAAFSLPTNQLSPVVTTKYGHHLILVTDKRPARTIPLEEATTNILRFLAFQQRPKVVERYLQQLREKASIEILLPAPAARSVETAPTSAAESTR